jgi:hypothetical protein
MIILKYKRKGIDVSVFFGMLDRLCLKSFVGQRALLIVLLMGLTGMRVRYLFYFDKSNWIDLVDRGFTTIRSDVSVGPLKIVCTLPDLNSCHFLRSLEWAHSYFSQYNYLCVNVKGGRLTYYYVTQHLNSLVIDAGFHKSSSSSLRGPINYSLYIDNFYSFLRLSSSLSHDSSGVL